MIRIFSVALLCFIAFHAISQAKREENKPTAPKQDKVIFNPDDKVVTNGEITIKTQKIAYRTTAGTQPVWNDDGMPIAGLFYTFYERTDIQGAGQRPIVISFNGGPGSASVWMHIGYTGPVLLNIDDEGYPVMPYGFQQNPYSILDVADIVYVDPVNTGFSRIVGKETSQNQFFGIYEDIGYLSKWIGTFITRNNRWASPKYLIGESYGTTRVAGLALKLQESEWMYLNGVILVSPTELGIKREGPVQQALGLPYFAATAWYHKKIPIELQNKKLEDFLPEVEHFTLHTLLPAISKGSELSDKERRAVATKMALYSGLSETIILQNNFDIDYRLFWKELLREKGYTIGRLDSRYLGVDKADAGASPDYFAELTSWSHSFTPAINMYLREQLNYKTDFKYNVFGDTYPWNKARDNTGNDLRKAMGQNPYLHVMVQSGYFDGGCDYFNARYNLWQMDPAGKFKNRISWHGYPSGHMMYLRKADLKTSTEHIREFILQSTPKQGMPAKH